MALSPGLQSERWEDGVFWSMGTESPINKNNLWGNKKKENSQLEHLVWQKYMNLSGDMIKMYWPWKAKIHLFQGIYRSIDALVRTSYVASNEKTFPPTPDFPPRGGSSGQGPGVRYTNPQNSMPNPPRPVPLWTHAAVCVHSQAEQWPWIFNKAAAVLSSW